MKIEIFVRAMQLLGQAYGEDYDKETIKLWYEFFGDCSFGEFKQAAKQYIAENEFKPTIAAMRKIIAKNKIGEIPSAEESWFKVIECVRKYGFYREDEALEHMDERTRKIVEYIGFREICSSCDNTWNKRDFIKMYNSECEQETQRILIGQNKRLEIEE